MFTLFMQALALAAILLSSLTSGEFCEREVLGVGKSRGLQLQVPVPFPPQPNGSDQPGGTSTLPIWGDPSAVERGGPPVPLNATIQPVRGLQGTVSIAVYRQRPVQRQRQQLLPVACELLYPAVASFSHALHFVISKVSETLLYFISHDLSYAYNRAALAISSLLKLHSEMPVQWLSPSSDAIASRMVWSFLGVLVWVFHGLCKVAGKVHPSNLGHPRTLTSLSAMAIAVAGGLSLLPVLSYIAVEIFCDNVINLIDFCMTASRQSYHGSSSDSDSGSENGDDGNAPYSMPEPCFKPFPQGWQLLSAKASVRFKYLVALSRRRHIEREREFYI